MTDWSRLQTPSDLPDVGTPFLIYFRKSGDLDIGVRTDENVFLISSLVDGSALVDEEKLDVLRDGQDGDIWWSPITLPTAAPDGTAQV